MRPFTWLLCCRFDSYRSRHLKQRIESPNSKQKNLNNIWIIQNLNVIKSKPILNTKVHRCKFKKIFGNIGLEFQAWGHSLAKQGKNDFIDVFTYSIMNRIKNMLRVLYLSLSPMLTKYKNTLIWLSFENKATFVI